MSNPVTIVDNVNPVDLFVDKQLTLRGLVYTLICGALSLLVALRLSDVVNTLSESFFDRYRISNPFYKAFANLLFILTVICGFAFLVRNETRKRRST